MTIGFTHRMSLVSLEKAVLVALGQKSRSRPWSQCQEVRMLWISWLRREKVAGGG